MLTLLYKDLVGINMISDFNPCRRDGTTKIEMIVPEYEHFNTKFYLNFLFEPDREPIEDIFKYKVALANIVKKYKEECRKRLIKVDVVYYYLSDYLYKGERLCQKMGVIPNVYMVDDVSTHYAKYGAKILDFKDVKRLCDTEYF